MAKDTEDEPPNPCCNKKGTLIITIEPCTAGKKVVPEREIKSEICFGYDDSLNSSLPRKTPRTMEIEVKIKGKDQKLFSDEDLPQEESTEESEHSIVSTHLEKKDSDKSTDRMICKSSIVLEKKPCSKTCPGPIICMQRPHYLGDDCHLHDPTAIGRQIMEMHKKGLFKAPIYNANKELYPRDLTYAISVIKDKKVPEKKTPENDAGAEMNDNLPPTKMKQGRFSDSRKSENIIEANFESNPELKSSNTDQAKRNRSGCFC